MHKLKFDKPDVNNAIGISDCCNARTHSIPPCFGDSEIILCSNCDNMCKREWKPQYEKVAPGTYRPVEYKITNKDLKW